MTAHHRTMPAQIDPARALAVRAMISHISALLDPGTARTLNCAASLLAQIDAAYPGAIQNNDQHLSLTLFTVRASAQHSTVALLRNWQSAARLWLETGAR
jgi:hypothetical protein